MTRFRQTLFLVPVLAAVASSAPAQSTRAHWAFVPPVSPPVPRIQNSKSRVQYPIDAFIVQKLRQRGLDPSPPADRRTLIRRVTFDLIGLPPTPAETGAFLADRSPDAYDKVVRRLLRSPHFGERWGQHWLDVVRFAESNGYEHDLDRPQAWRYRDWVVSAFNADKPYDRFIREQVAGDLFFEKNFDARVATGFLRAGPFHITGGNLDPKEMRQEWLTEAVNGIGNSILGVTIGCARCHDHKIDPILQADYYRLQAFFSATANDDHTLASEEDKKRYEDAVKAAKERKQPIEAEIAAIEKPYRETLRAQKMERLPAEYKAVLAIPAEKRTSEQKRVAGEANTQLNISWDEVVESLSPEHRVRRSNLRQKLFAIDREMPPPLPTAPGVGEVLKPLPTTHILVRGEVHKPGDAVEPGLPGCLGDRMKPVDRAGQGGRAGESRRADRLALARWLTAPDNPLTARVMVNRIWHYLMGRGIVATPNDFGKNGKLPTHPDLLDWLAMDFTRDWSVKRMIRQVVTSNAYRQSSLPNATGSAADPENALLWRMNRKRLDAEAIRDSVLAVSGALNLEIGGPSVRIPLEPEVYDTIFTEYEPDNLWDVTPDPRQHARRSLYLFRKRNVRLPMMALFDQPDMMTSCAARGQTVHALQALTLVNSEFMRKQSELLAARLRAKEPDRRKQIGILFELALGRPPAEKELRATEGFLADQSRLAGAARATADLCLATLNLNEFLYVR